MIWKIGLFVLITLIVTGLLATIQQKINLDFEKIVLPQLAPAIGFLIMTLLFKSMRMPIGFDFNKLIAIKSLLALGLPFLLITIAFIIGKLIGLEPKFTNDLTPLISIMLIGIIIGSVGEEIGWRSFLQPTLEKNNSVILASIIVGLIWGLWHIGHYKNGLLFMIGFLIFTISASIILAWILRETRYNIIIAVLFHTSINIGFFVLFKNSLTDSKLMIINGIVWLIPAIGILIMTGKDLIKT
jgi:membrane protease YdiL (CAAX protease family)